MNAIHVRKHIDSGLVEAIPELRGVIGQDVDIFIVPQSVGEDDGQETAETFLGDALHRPPPTDEERAELRAMATQEPGLAAFLQLADEGGLDIETILAVRNAE